jgi:cytochrome c-type biogenesis protein CcmH
MRLRALLAAVAGVLCMAAAADPAERLRDPSQEARARHLFEQVRCLVCQNESIDDSQADLARDLRGIVREQVRAGRSDDQIKRFLFGVVGLGLLLWRARMARGEPERELDAAETERLRRLQDGLS